MLTGMACCGCPEALSRYEMARFVSNGKVPPIRIAHWKVGSTEFHFKPFP